VAYDSVIADLKLVPVSENQDGSRLRLGGCVINYRVRGGPAGSGGIICLRAGRRRHGLIGLNRRRLVSGSALKDCGRRLRSLIIFLLLVAWLLLLLVAVIGGVIGVVHRYCNGHSYNTMMTMEVALVVETVRPKNWPVKVETNVRWRGRNRSRAGWNAGRNIVGSD